MAEHVWFHERLETYCADGLTAEERARFEEHAEACASCRRALDEVRGFDRSLDQLFAEVRPAAGWESRVIEHLRMAPAPRRLRWSASLRWIAAAAAVIVVGALGAALHTVMENTAGSPLKMIASGILGDLHMAKDVDDDRANYFQPSTTRTQVRNELKQIALGVHAGKDVEAVDELRTPRGETTAKTDPDSDDDKKVKGKTDNRPAATEGGEAGGRFAGFGTGFNGGFGVGGFGGGGFTGGGGWSATTATGPGMMPPGTPPGRANGGMIDGSVKSPGDHRIADLERIADGDKDGAKGDPVKEMKDLRQEVRTATESWGRLPEKHSVTVTASPDGRSMNKPAKPGEQPPVEGLLPLNLASPSTATNDQRESSAAPGSSKDIKNAQSGQQNLGYHKIDPKSPVVPGLSPPTSPAGEKSPPDDRLDEQGARNKVKDGTSNMVAVGQPKKSEPPKTPPEPPAAAQRKIIRTGELEFEVQSFDSAVGDVNKLIIAIPGAFIATVNSEKLPNGKVRGSAVVRVPPDRLDQFVLDLRRDLTKAGELKSQRIGSQDVTKQYTDIESRLRAARTMEERLINIIKSGKGEIKDLLNAERELGVWRTKIEEMEGEIRYYNNQVSLSTLTITMYEKEIRAAAEMVIAQHVTMKIETDDVEKALQTALTAVTDAKGRVTRSDMKQHSAGQYEAVLEFHVAPAASIAVRDKLRKLGVVTHQDTQRSQQAVGGAAAAEIKSRQDDVRFLVTLYNVANIQPRETFNLQLAVPDVAAEYRKLQEAVLQADGQVRTAQLNEQDKLNVTAHFDFDVPAIARNVIDKLVASLGDVITRSTARAAPGETATDRKVGYRLVLRSMTSIAARETYTLQTATSDVVAGYRTLQEAVAKAKGHVRGAQINEQDKSNVTAQVDFDVPTAERGAIDKLLQEIGEVYSRSTARAAQDGVATDRKVGYRVTLRDVAAIPPRESFALQAVSQDVVAGFRKLQEAVARVKGHVRAEQLNEQDKLKVSATFEFDVPTGERATIDKLLEEIGEVYSRNTHRAGPNEAATDRKVGYRLTLWSAAGMPPRETVKLKIEVSDVERAATSMKDMVKVSKGRVVGERIQYEPNGQVTALLAFDVPLTAKEDLVRRFKGVGTLRFALPSQHPQVPETEFSIASLDVVVTSGPPIVPSDDGLWPQIRTSLSYAFRMISWSLMFIILGLSVVLPWALVIWLAVRVVRRLRAKAQPAT